MKKIIFLLFLCAPALYALEFLPEIAEGSNLSLLQSGARRFDFSINKYEKDNSPYLYAISDYHTVFDLEMNTVIDVLTALDRGGEVFSRVVDTIDLEPNKPLTVPHLQRVHNRASLLGISEEYIYTITMTIESRTENECLIHWNLVDCELGNIIGHEGYWYLKSLDSPNPTPLTYVRMKADTLFINPIPFQELVMKLLTDSETNKMFKELHTAAAKTK